MVRAARATALAFFHPKRVWTTVPQAKARRQTGKPPIGTRWIDVNKGDTRRPKYRSRLVAKEYKVDARPELFAATPPTEYLRMLLSKAAEAKTQKEPSR